MTDRSPSVLNRSVPAGIFVKVDILSNFVWWLSIVAGGFFCGDNKKIYSSMSQNKITVDMHLYIVYI